MHILVKNNGTFTFLTLSVLLFICSPADAYLGPGSAVSSIGALLALIGSIILAVIGFVWFPVKRILAEKKQRKKKDSEDNGNTEKEPKRP